MAPSSIRVVIDVRRAFERYARLALSPGEWDRLMAAHRWFRDGGWLQRLWRHCIYKQLWPCRYEERRLQAEDAERHMKRAVIVAVFDKMGKAMPRWQNWRMN